MSRVAVAAALLGAAIMGAGCSASQPRRTPRVPIVVARAEARTVPYEIEATGTVEPLESAAVTAQVGGLVTRVAFREGDEVGASRVLFQIDPRPFEAALAKSLAELARDRAQAQNAELDLKRAEALAAQQLIAPGDLDQKRSAAEALSSQAGADSAAVAAARLDLSHATIRAPIAGKTGNVSVHVGDLVKANDTPLVTINQIRPIRVRFTVTQADLPEVRRPRDHPLTVEAAPADRDSLWVEGRLAFVDNAVDPSSGTLLLKGEFPNRDGALWPGAFVRVRLRLYEQSGATVVPAVAVTNSQNGPYCFVVKPDTTVEARPVEVARTWRDLAVVASGLKPGEIVVTDGQLRLAPGMKALIRTASAARSQGDDP